MIKNWKKYVFYLIFATYCFYLIYSIYLTCSGGEDCLSKPIWPGIVIVLYVAVATFLLLFLYKISSIKVKDKKIVEKWYKFSVWLLAISLVELFSSYFLQIVQRQTIGPGNGIVSIAVGIPLVQLFGAKFADSITGFIHNTLNLWFIWGSLVWLLRRKMKANYKNEKENYA